MEAPNYWIGIRKIVFHGSVLRFYVYVGQWQPYMANHQILVFFVKKSELDDEWPESIFHHVGSQSVSYLLSVQCEVLSRVS